MPPKLEVGGRILSFPFSRFLYISCKNPKRKFGISGAIFEKEEVILREISGEIWVSGLFPGIFWTLSG